MTEVADLRIRVESDSVPQAERRLKGMADAGGRAERATDGLVGSIAKFASAAAVGAAALATFNKLLDVQRKFDIINSGLITATGSAEGASVAFEAIRDFATKTPYDLGQVADSFVKLVNLGLTPSERALTSYGNTASAMGKDLNQMIEAVADAATGEFERLKEFGIRASKQGDQVKFTFRGVSETVAFESGAIEDYLIKLGETNFADSMANRMKTLDGALSNLGDAWDQTFLNISNSGVGEMIADLVNVGIDALGTFNDWLATGELEGAISSLGESFRPWAEDAVEATQIVSGALADLTDWLNTEYPEDMQVLSDAWSDFPENIRAIIQIVSTYVAAFVVEVENYADGIRGAFAAMADGWGGKTVLGNLEAYRAASKRNGDQALDSAGAILQERQATIDAARAAREAAIEKAAAAKKERDARRATMAGQDRLAGFGVDRPAGGSGGPGGRPKKDAEAERRRKAFESLVEDLRTEEEALAQSYERRRSLIEQHTSAESASRADLMGRLEAWRKDEEEQIADQKSRQLRQIEQSLMTEEQAIQASYERRRQIVLDSTADGEARQRLLERLAVERDEDLAREQAERQSRRDRLLEEFMTEEDLARQSRDRKLEDQRAGYSQGLIDKEEFERNKAEIERRYQETLERIQRNRLTTQIDGYAGMVGALGQLFGQFAQGQGKSAERMFRISKALNMAQVIMSTASGIMKAQELGYPMNIVESIRIGALGAMQLAAISSQRFAGAYDKGGRIPAGKVGIVGERGMEVVEGPANVTGREATARLLRQAAEGGGGNQIAVSISVSVDNRGNSTSTTEATGGGADAENARRLGALIDERVRAILIKEQRQDGLLTKRG